MDQLLNAEKPTSAPAPPDQRDDVWTKPEDYPHHTGSVFVGTIAAGLGGLSIIAGIVCLTPAAIDGGIMLFMGGLILRIVASQATFANEDRTRRAEERETAKRTT